MYILNYQNFEIICTLILWVIKLLYRSIDYVSVVFFMNTLYLWNNCEFLANSSVEFSNYEYNMAIAQ